MLGRGHTLHSTPEWPPNSPKVQNRKHPPLSTSGVSGLRAVAGRRGRLSAPLLCYPSYQRHNTTLVQIREAGGVEALVALMRVAPLDPLMEAAMGALHNVMLTGEGSGGRMGWNCRGGQRCLEGLLYLLSSCLNQEPYCTVCLQIRRPRLVQ